MTINNSKASNRERIQYVLLEGNKIMNVGVSYSSLQNGVSDSRRMEEAAGLSWSAPKARCWLELTTRGMA